MNHKDTSENNIIVSNKLFKLLWNEATKYNQEDLSEFVDYFLSASSPERIAYKEIGFDSSSFQNFLERIFYYSHLGFKDILDLTHYGVTEFSDAFCIPLATVKTWAKKTGSNCAPYTILLYLKYFDLLDFGSIQIQESIKRYEYTNCSDNSTIQDSTNTSKYSRENFIVEKSNSMEHSSKQLVEFYLGSSQNNSSDTDFSKSAFPTKQSSEDILSPPLRKGPFHNMSTQETLSRVYGNCLFRR